MIRKLIHSDKAAVIQLIREFFDEELSERGLVFNEEQCLKDFDWFIELETSIALVIENDGVIDGVIGGIVLRRPFFGDITAHEILWYIRQCVRRDGFKLLERFETIGKERGAGSATISTLVDSKVENVLKRSGYVKRESMHTKILR